MLSFKKGSIFDRPAKVQEDFMDELGNQALVVRGSSGSGKSTAVVKLAEYLVRKKRNAILPTCDMTAPMLPCICLPANLECEHSLGSMLAVAQAAQSLVRHDLTTHKEYDYLTLTGMLREENEYTYLPYNAKQAAELITCLREMVLYVIINCGSYIVNDILSATVLMESDTALRPVNCDLKSVNYLSSQLSPLRDNKWDADRQYKVTSNIRPNEVSEYMEQVFGSMTFKPPYCVELVARGLAGDLLVDLSLRESKRPRKVIGAISREVFRCQGKSAPGIYLGQDRSGRLADRRQ